MSQSLIDRTLGYLKKRRLNIDNGNINSIESPFPRYSDYLVGVEQATYYIVTGYSGGGKSQFGYYFFVFEPLMFLYENRDKLPNLKYTIFCLPLEETPDRITQRFISYLLFRYSRGRYLISPKNLRSSENKRPVPYEILQYIEEKEFRNILEFFESNVNFVLDVTPNQFFNKVKKYCEDNGTTHYKKVQVENEFGDIEEKEEFDYYVPNNPDEYVMVFVDHISLLPSYNNLYGTILEFSNNMITLRNRYGVSPVIIQQQGATNESLDAFKLDRPQPTKANLADCKSTAKDANIILSIYSPYGHSLKSWKGYDLTELKDNIRFIEMLKNRDGPENISLGLLFNGACSYFKELAPPNDTSGLIHDTTVAKEYEYRSRNLIYIKDQTDLSISFI